MESNPNCNAVFKHPHTAETQPLTENQQHDCNIHGISHVPKQPADDQMLRGEDRRGRTETLEGETSEGVQKHGKTCGNHEHSDEPKQGGSQQRCSNMPSANQPRHVARNDPRSNREEYYRAENGERSPHWVVFGFQPD